MSSAIISAGQLKPELRLAQAISEFEATILGDQQKAQFRTQKQQSPDSNDVMRLTAEMYRSVKGSRRSYGPRWTNFLESVQRFASIGDVLIGGSQYLPACAAWTVVRFSLMAITQQATYMDQLSSFFMDLGRTAPRYQSMASIWPKSKTLQKYLLEYFIVVTQLCLYIFKVCNQSLLKQITSTMQGPLESFKSKLDSWAGAIRDEMHIQTSQLVKAGAEESRRHRDSFQRFMHLSRTTQARMSMQDLLDKFSKYDYRTTWKQIRKCGSTKLLVVNPDYRTWLSLNQSATLNYVGTLGSGKSVLLANMVDDIVTSQTQAIVTYFFCKHDIQSSLQADTIIRSIVRQILEQQLKQDWTPNDLGLSSDSLSKPYLDVDDTRLSKVLQSCIRERKVFVVLDGLDECEIKARRQNIDLTLDLMDNGTITTITISLPKDNPDIEAFIDEELQDRINLGELNIGDHHIVPVIKEALLKGSQGMFLWVVLQIKSLCMMHTDHAILEAIQDLPIDLPETYRRRLQSMDDLHQQELQRKIFEWMMIAKVPLTAMELREALSITPCELDWDWTKLINNIQPILGYCGGLVVTDEEEHTIRFIHHSVKQFVTSAAEANRSWAVDIERASEHSTAVLLTYLNLRILSTQLCESGRSRIDTETMISHIKGSVARDSAMTSWIASGLLKSRRSPKFDIGMALNNVKNSRNQGDMSFKFHKYASRFWCHHILDIEKPSPPLLRLLDLAITQTAVDLDQVLDDGSTSWIQVAAKDRSELLELFLTSSRTDIRESISLGPMLVEAVISGSHEVLDVLAQKDAVYPKRLYDQNITLLHLAALHGQLRIAGWLLVMDIKRGGVTTYIDDLDVNGETPLMLAATHGHVEVVRLLLKSHADPHIRAQHNNKDALEYAIDTGQAESVKILATEVAYDICDVIHALCYAEKQDSVEALCVLLDSFPNDSARIMEWRRRFGRVIERKRGEAI